MKRTIILLLFLTQVMTLVSQSLFVPAITIKDDNLNDEPITLSSVSIDVKIVGHRAVTTLDMQFYNPNNRTMEGELLFPLGDDKYITRFALDVNGKLREGVTVDKTKGREAFEAIVRRRVDPGLMEMEEGNTFRVRVYPLFGRATKRVVIAYEEDLKRSASGYHYTLPLGYNDTLRHFAFSVQVAGSKQMPDIRKNPWGDVSFSNKDNIYSMSFESKEYRPQGETEFIIPSNPAEQVFIQRGVYGNKNMFYMTATPPDLSRPKVLPKKIAILQDASLSMTDRKLQEELTLLHNYFQEIKNCSVELQYFNYLSTKKQTFSVENGHWEELRETINQISFDGATALGNIDLNSLHEIGRASCRERV